MAHAADIGLLRDLERHLAALGAVDLEFWHAGMAPEELDLAFLTSARLQEAELILIALSPELLASNEASDESNPLINAAFARQAADSAQIILILAESIARWGPPFETVRLLPRDAKPIRSRSNVEEAFMEVATAVRNAVQNLRARRAAMSDRGDRPLTSAVSDRSSWAVGVPIGGIFSSSRTESATYVAPIELSKIVTCLQTMGGGLVVEGPSQSGKSTAVDKALGTAPVRWLTCRRPKDVTTLREIIDGDTLSGHLVIDDLDFLDDDRALLEKLALFIRDTSTGRSAPTGKVTLICINQSGPFFSYANKHIGNRLERIKIEAQPTKKILELIKKGELVSNVRFRHGLEFANAAEGSFALAQKLCYKAASRVIVSQPAPAYIGTALADVEPDVMHELAAQYEEPLLRLFRAPGGLGIFGALWLSNCAMEREIELERVATRYPQLEVELEWIRRDDFAISVQRDPDLREMLEFKPTKIKILNPLVQFYLRRVVWLSLASQAEIQCRVSTAGELEIKGKVVHGPLVSKGGAPQRPGDQPLVIPLLDRIPYPWAEPAARRLHELLTCAYEGLESASAIAAEGGVPLSNWKQTGSISNAWRELINVSVRSGTLRRLVKDVVLRDEGVKGLWMAIREAIGEP